MPSPQTKKTRIDQLLVERGLAPSRKRAQAMILAGKVLVAEQRVDKASQTFLPDALIRIKGPDHPYVGRGGVKLAGALEGFAIDPKDKTCLDVGASTGGFTDCLLQAGAKRVYTLDVGTNQLDYRIRQDPRVVSQENFNVRFLKKEDLSETIDLIVMDVSFISVKLLLPVLQEAIPGPWDMLVLVKPQFEAGPERLSRGGILRDIAEQGKIVADIRDFSASLGYQVLDTAASVLCGEDGNQEYFMWLRNQGP